MTRINTPSPAAQATSGPAQHTEAEPSNAHRRPSARHPSPQGLPQRAGAQADTQQAAQPGRARAGLQTLRQTAQAVVDGGTGIASAGARLGTAAGAAFLAAPLRNTGISMLVGGASYAVVNHQLDNPLETLRGIGIASAGWGLTAASNFMAVLPGAVQAVAEGVRALPGALRAVADGLQAVAETAAAEGRVPQISQELAIAAINHVMVFGEPDPDDPDDLSQEVAPHAPQVIDHLTDLRAGAASEAVHAAALASNGNSAQLVRNLHALVTADPPVLSNRPNSQGARTS
ncbi:hypothetical protein [Acidovorax sp. SUPP3334]|uniref:hypothetical protein n=1 Tax=Acidovorax sp. SUPP3334 TaxID=2920881 RepID=UPI0023DE26FB|nr:hypothetical protein [Acidovorax sp. SUPP3334]GKT24646.1 hypothetical protein AVHM3334_15420 [Acidovorax sp. SUPP3334]